MDGFSAELEIIWRIETWKGGQKIMAVTALREGV